MYDTLAEIDGTAELPWGPYYLTYKNSKKSGDLNGNGTYGAEVDSYYIQCINSNGKIIFSRDPVQSNDFHLNFYDTKPKPLIAFLNNDILEISKLCGEVSTPLMTLKEDQHFYDLSPHFTENHILIEQRMPDFMYQSFNLYNDFDSEGRNIFQNINIDTLVRQRGTEPDVFIAAYSIQEDRFEYYPGVVITAEEDGGCTIKSAGRTSEQFTVKLKTIAPVARVDRINL
jgi:hypothetical protein